MKLHALSYIEYAIGNLQYMFLYATKYLYSQMNFLALSDYIEFPLGNFLHLVLDSTKYLCSTD